MVVFKNNKTTQRERDKNPLPGLQVFLHLDTGISSQSGEHKRRYMSDAGWSNSKIGVTEN